MSYVDVIRNAEPTSAVRELMSRVYDVRESLPNDLYAWLSAFAMVQHDRLHADTKNDLYTIHKNFSISIEHASTMLENTLVTNEVDARLKECADNARASGSPWALLEFGQIATSNMITKLTAKKDAIEHIILNLKRMRNRVRVSSTTKQYAIKFRCEELNISYDFFKHSHMRIAQILHRGEDETQFYRDFLQWMRAEANEKLKVFSRERSRVCEDIARKRATFNLLGESLSYLQQCNDLERM